MLETPPSITTASITSRIGRLFVVVALLEALTWSGLLIGMFLKYVTKTTDVGVTIFGSLHGAAFLLYLVVAVIAARHLRWSWQATALVIAGAIPPLATIPIEMNLRRKGMLNKPDNVPETL
jgi:integral membrane protein